MEHKDDPDLRSDDADPFGFAESRDPGLGERTYVEKDRIEQDDLPLPPPVTPPPPPPEGGTGGA
ncbi:hypothetical protein [Thermomonospora cellulosilytica]|nr:hypothetical protein [Thermomonospora cellulosilytica]